MNPVLDLQAFIPAQDHDLCKQFYTDLGFKMTWEGDKIAQFEIGNFHFLLQEYPNREYAENYMISMTVESVDAYWRHIQDIKLAEKYPTIRLKAPEMKPWGIYTLHLIDPAGVLWHIGEKPKAV